MTLRLVNNFIEQQRIRIDAVSKYMGDLATTTTKSAKYTDMSAQEALTNVGIAYLRFTGNTADKALSEIICGIALLLGNINKSNPIGKTGDHQKEVEMLVIEYKSATDLLEPIFALIGTLLRSSESEANIAGLDLVKCLQAYAELIVYQDRRRIRHKNDFLDILLQNYL
jgi:hypothetical protein